MSMDSGGLTFWLASVAEWELSDRQWIGAILALEINHRSFSIMIGLCCLIW